jgi:hypothetical protein
MLIAEGSMDVGKYQAMQWKIDYHTQKIQELNNLLNEKA